MNPPGYFNRMAARASDIWQQVFAQIQSARLTGEIRVWVQPQTDGPKDRHV